MALDCSTLPSCLPCTGALCKWVEFENKTESCHNTVEHLEGVVKMIEKSEDCKAPPAPPAPPADSDWSFFGELAGSGLVGFLLCIITILICGCLQYFRLGPEQRRVWQDTFGCIFRVCNMFFQLYHQLRGQADQMPFINDEEDPEEDEGDGMGNPGGNLRDDEAEDDMENPFADLELGLDDLEVGGDEDNNEEEEEGQENEGVEEEEQGNENEEEQIQEPAGPLFVIGHGGQPVGAENPDDDVEEEHRPPRRNPPRRAKDKCQDMLRALQRHRQID